MAKAEYSSSGTAHSGQTLQAMRKVLRLICAHQEAIMELLTEQEKVLEQLASPKGMPAQPSDLCRVLINTRAYGPSTDDPEPPCHSSLILDVLNARVQVARVADDLKLQALWVKIGWGPLKVLYTGMMQPGIPFGHLAIRDPWGGTAELEPTSLRRYVTDVRKAIGGSKSEGPHLRRLHVNRDISSTGWGYVLDPQWTYEVTGNERDTSSHTINTYSSNNQQPPGRRKARTSTP